MKLMYRFRFKKVVFLFAVIPFCSASFLFSSVLFLASPAIAHADAQSDKEAALQQQLAEVEAEQAATLQVLNQTQQQSASLQRDITILDTKIKAAQLNIQAKNLLIQTLGQNIEQKSETIADLTQSIEKSQDSLSQILRATYKLDTYSEPEILLSQGSLSSLVFDTDAFNFVEESLKKTFTDLRSNKDLNQSQKDDLNKRQAAELDARKVIEQEQANIKADETEKQRLLNISKGNEKSYASILADKRAKAAQIRAALFALRDTAAIPFDKALQYATQISKSTGVRPAFLLAILTQESALGQNVGSCYLTDANTGSGSSAKSGAIIPNVMKPGRDTTPFFTITGSLGIDPYKTLVSCPQSIGYGGAMGPAQFIPSTWMLFAKRISGVTGSAIANPWDPYDAFTASALYLGDLGASSGMYTAERNAACKYYSGKTCSQASINHTYGDQVMAKAQSIQDTMINPLQGL